MSENISVRRIVDLYMKHEGIIIFHVTVTLKFLLALLIGCTETYTGRVEVCFPVYDERLRKEIIQIVRLQLQNTCRLLRLIRVATIHPSVAMELAMFHHHKKPWYFLEFTTRVNLLID